jgi:hypothetical protein
MKTLDEVKRRHVLSVLRRCKGNKVAACATLDVSRRSMDRWVMDWNVAALTRTWRTSKWRDVSRRGFASR